MNARAASTKVVWPLRSVWVTVMWSPWSVTESTRVLVWMETPRRRYWRVNSFETSGSSLGSARSAYSRIWTSTP